MYMVLKMIGSGTDASPFDVDLPTKVLVASFEDDRTAIASVPPGVCPADAPDLDSPLWQKFGHMRILVGLTPKQLGAWYDQLDKSYPRGPVGYRPDFP